MNPQVAFWFQQLVQMGYSQQQAMQYAQQMANMTSSGQGQQGTSPNDLQSNLASLFGTQAGISSLQGPYNLEKQAAETSMNPQLMNQRINAFTRNLSPALIHAVTRATTPAIAERGLGTSAAMSQQIIGEALAPYQLQEQQMGNQLAESTLQPAFAYGSGLGSVMAGQHEDLATLLGLLGSQ